jgi:nucleoside-diphosphate-sugar epimerase
MARILVTGGSGFIGAGIVKHLAARGDEVIAFDMARTLRLEAVLAEHRNSEFIEGEITEWPQVMIKIRLPAPRRHRAGAPIPPCFRAGRRKRS